MEHRHDAAPMVIVGVVRALPIVLAMSGVVWAAPLLAVPMLGCLAIPVAFPALAVFAFGPLLGLQGGTTGPATATGALLLFVGGVANAGLAMTVLTHAHTVLLGRFPSVPLIDLRIVGGGLVVWGLLVLGAALGRRSGTLGSAVFATAFVAVAPLTAAVLALYDALGLPLGA